MIKLFMTVCFLLCMFIPGIGGAFLGYYLLTKMTLRTIEEQVLMLTACVVGHLFLCAWMVS